MRRLITIALMVAPFVSGCQEKTPSERQKSKSEQNLAEYAKSPEGRRAMALTQEKAASKLRAKVGVTPSERTKRSIEGVWTSTPSKDGKTLRVSFSRDGLATMEEVDAKGGSSNFAQGSMTVVGARISGTMTDARKGLKPFAKWSLSRRSGTSAFLMGAKKLVPVSKRN